MDGKTKIELDNDTAEQFKLFCKVTQDLKGYKWKISQTQKYKEHRVILFINIKKLDKIDV